MFNRILDYIFIFFAVIAGCLLIFNTLSINFEVVMRYFLNSPTSWVVDFNSYALVYITFLSSAWVLVKGGHVKIEILVDRLPFKGRRWLNLITCTIGALLCALLCWLSMQMTLSAIRKGDMLIEATVVPKWPIVIVIPIGSFLLMVQFIRMVIYHAKSKELLPRK